MDVEMPGTDGLAATRLILAAVATCAAVIGDNAGYAANAAGGLLWASFYTLGAYALGNAASTVGSTILIIGYAVASVLTSQGGQQAVHEKFFRPGGVQHENRTCRTMQSRKRGRSGKGPFAARRPVPRGQLALLSGPLVRCSA
jgi:hypothetical protein